MFFRKQRNVIAILIARLKEFPDEVFVSEGYMATYNADLDTVLIWPGDFRSLDQEELMAVLQMRVDKVTP